MTLTGDQLAIFLADDRTAFRPGEMLRGSILWALAKAPRELDVRLFWRTKGKGTTDLEIVATKAISLPAAAGEEAFLFALPAEPWSFSGKLISVIWGVEVVAAPDGQNASVEFVLGPHGREIVLTPIDST